MLYVIFLLTFAFGDLISTALAMQLKAKPDPIIAEKCVCKLPPECDVNPIIRRNPTLFRMILVKSIIAIAVLSLIIFIKNPIISYALIIFSILGIFAVATNLTIYYWQLSYFMMVIVAFVSILLLGYFTKIRR